MKNPGKINLLKEMVRIRLVEQYIARRYPEEKMRCPTHLCLGQEAAPAVFGSFAKKEDVFAGTYRSHGHYLAKGGDLTSLFAELLGSSRGCSGGYGGSMHIIDKDINFLGTSAIVGGGVPIATGAAFAIRSGRKKNVAVCFLGDGAMEEGAVYESVNFATLFNLPIIYVCENNRLAVTTPIELRTSNTQLYRRFADMGIKTGIVDDTDIDGMIKLADEAFRKARGGKGPSFIEISVHRWATHVGHDYEGPSEQWYTDPHAKDALSCPIATLVRQLLRSNEITFAELAGLRKKTQLYVEKIFRQAEKFPSADDGNFEDKVYASGTVSKLPVKASKAGGAGAGRVYKHREQSKLVNPF